MGTTRYNTGYEVYTHTTTWSGIWASAQSGDCKIIKMGRLVIMQIPQVTATANTGSFITMDTVLPSRFRPSIEVHLYIPVMSNGLNSVAGATKITTGGALTVQLQATLSGTFTGNFTGANTGGIYGAVSISWQI